MYLLFKFHGRTRGVLWEHVRKSARKTPEIQGARDATEKQRKRSEPYASETN